MKRAEYKSTFHIYVIFFVLLIGTLAAGFGMVVYNITIQKPDGHAALSKWPIDFTKDFSAYLYIADDQPRVKQSGLNLLLENGLWLQILDANGDEIQNFDRPTAARSHYSPWAILNACQNGIGKDSVFVGSIHSDGHQWTYLIGFPLRISKVTMIFNGDRFTSFKPVVFVLFGVTLLLLILSGFIYSFLVTKQTDRIRKSIREIASRAYIPVSSTGSFGNIYKELNAMNAEIRAGDEARVKNQKLREEWIANITHDLKTPLSPIRGYAELISDANAKLEADGIRKYGDIILKNTAYAEALINDLKLTYQLKSEMLPLHKSTQNIVRFTKELVIDLLNNPEYKQRSLSFCAAEETIDLAFDAVLLKRALNNLITNALVHNDKNTDVSVSITVIDRITIRIQDNGCGMTKEELDNLFVRYYRGETTAANPEGSGLGMAIAKQIIELHGGRISAKSELRAGTVITAQFPKQN